MKLSRDLLPSLAVVTTIWLAGSMAPPAKASLAMEVLGDQVMVENMILNGDTYASLGSFGKNTLPFEPSLKYPSHVTLQAILHVRNPTNKRINISKVAFDVYSYDPWTRHKHYVTTVIRHIPPDVQRYLHLGPHEERHSPPNAKSLQFHLPYTSLFHDSSLDASPFASLASAMNLVGEAEAESLSVMNVVSPANNQRNLEFFLGNMDVQGTPVPAPLGLAGPWLAYQFAKTLRRRTAATSP
jgi:hypothetical protein